MIRYVNGNIFASRCEALVCPVNVVGVMGAGLAKAFAKRWPDLERAYKRACRAGYVGIGRCWTWHGSSRTVVCFPTKGDWRKPSTIDYIDRGLPSLVAEVQRWSIQSLAIPALGCGLGGLSWDDVRPRIERAFRSVACDLDLYEP